jgi:nucleoporin GLE1
MLIQRDQEFNAEQDYKTEQLQWQLAKDLEESIQRHEAVRAHAVNTLEQYRQELHRAEQERIVKAQLKKSEEAELARQREAEIRRREQEAAELILQEERKKAEDAEKLKKTREAAEALKKQREEAEATQRREGALSTSSQNPPVAQAQQNGAIAVPKPPAPQNQAPALQELPKKQMPPTATSSSGVTSSIEDRDNMHQKYLALHKRLKKIRTDIKTAGQGIKEWRDKRLPIKKLLGQLANENGDGLNEIEKRAVRAANLQRRKEIIAILQGAQRAPGPTLDARDYIVSPQSNLTRLDPSAVQVPTVFIYLLNMCAKAAINTIKKTAPAVVESVGITIAFVFGSIDLRFHGESFIDILLAKYHFVSPILFGIYGPENTEKGRLRLGWPNDELDNGKRAWVDEKTFFEEQQYLAVGWAALTLRDFKKAKTSNNACPPWNYWKSIACIVNTPPEQVTRLHFVVLKNLLENHADKFIKFYGQAATVALRTAIIVFPGRQGQKQSTERNGLEFLKDGLKRQWGIVL